MFQVYCLFNIIFCLVLSAASNYISGPKNILPSKYMYRIFLLGFFASWPDKLVKILSLYDLWQVYFRKGLCEKCSKFVVFAKKNYFLERKLYISSWRSKKPSIINFLMHLITSRNQILIGLLIEFFPLHQPLKRKIRNLITWIYTGSRDTSKNAEAPGACRPCKQGKHCFS